MINLQIILIFYIVIVGLCLLLKKKSFIFVLYRINFKLDDYVREYFKC